MHNPPQAQTDKAYYTQRLARFRVMRDTLTLSPLARKMVLDEISYMQNYLNSL